MSEFVSECSLFLMAKIRTILLRPENQEEILVYMRSIFDRRAEKDREAGDDWLKGSEMVMENYRRPNPEHPELPPCLPSVLLRVTVPDGTTIEGNITVRTSV